MVKQRTYASVQINHLQMAPLPPFSAYSSTNLRKASITVRKKGPVLSKLGRAVFIGKATVCPLHCSYTHSVSHSREAYQPHMWQQLRKERTPSQYSTVNKCASLYRGHFAEYSKVAEQFQGVAVQFLPCMGHMLCACTLVNACTSAHVS